MTTQSGTTGEARRARLVQHSQRSLAERPLILVSNRGPVEHHLTPDGRTEPRRGSGGVVTALSALAHNQEFTWIASAMGEGDRRVAAEGHAVKSPIPGHRISLRYVSTPRRVYHKYYNVICNPLLWFLQHYMWNSPYNPNIDATVYDAWDNGYVPVNQAFADAILAQASASHAPPFVLAHDYHLYLVPGMVRSKLPDAVLQFFVHIPWPTVRYWQILPASMRHAIVDSLCSADIVGFQSEPDVRGFLDCASAFLTDARVDHNAWEIEYRGRRCRARVYPISIDVDEVRRIAVSYRAEEYVRRLTPLASEHTIIRVDRAEPSKNIVRGFRAYQALLHAHPELAGKVVFLAFLVPSRTHIKQYQRYVEEVDAAVREINGQFGRDEWKPITVFYENNYTQAIAAMRLYDVLMVNAIIDGMNLVAKEGPVVNRRSGVLLLSETTGAHHQLREGALSVAPADVEGTTRALYQAITMSLEERAERQSRLVAAIEDGDINAWLNTQLDDLDTVVRERFHPAA